MDFFSINRNWEDEDTVELNVEARNRYVVVKQTCYISGELLEDYANRIEKFLYSDDEDIYLEFGEINGNFTPAFSMKIIKTDVTGHIKLDLNMENEDDETRQHRCGLFVNTEFGLLFSFSEQLMAFANNQRDSVNLNDN